VSEPGEKGGAGEAPPPGDPPTRGATGVSQSGKLARWHSEHRRSLTEVQDLRKHLGHLDTSNSDTAVVQVRGIASSTVRLR
jgi:hypothetical protein